MPPRYTYWTILIDNAPTAFRAIKREVKDVLVVTDVCLCEYTDHGHCGLIIDHEIAKRMMKGKASGLLTFGVKGGRAAGER